MRTIKTISDEKDLVSCNLYEIAKPNTQEQVTDKLQKVRVLDFFHIFDTRGYCEEDNYDVANNFQAIFEGRVSEGTSFEKINPHSHIINENRINVVVFLLSQYDKSQGLVDIYEVAKNLGLHTFFGVTRLDEQLTDFSLMDSDKAINTASVSEEYTQIDQNLYESFNVDDSASVIFNYKYNSSSRNFNNEKSVLLFLLRILSKIKGEKVEKVNNNVKTYFPFEGEEIIKLIKETN